MFKCHTVKELPPMEENIVVEASDINEKLSSLEPCHCFPSPSVPPSLKLCVISRGGGSDKRALSIGVLISLNLIQTMTDTESTH